jgi:hypothetical protein
VPQADPVRYKEYQNKYKERNKAQRRVYGAQYWRKNKTKLSIQAKVKYDATRAFTDSLKNKPCADCGRWFPPECMDFDHVRGEKVLAIAHLVPRGLHRVKQELPKCDEPVCANCHRIRTAKRREEKKKKRSERQMTLL